MPARRENVENAHLDNNNMYMWLWTNLLAGLRSLMALIESAKITYYTMPYTSGRTVVRANTRLIEWVWLCALTRSRCALCATACKTRAHAQPAGMSGREAPRDARGGYRTSPECLPMVSELLLHPMMEDRACSFRSSCSRFVLLQRARVVWSAVSLHGLICLSSI